MTSVKSQRVMGANGCHGAFFRQKGHRISETERHVALAGFAALAPGIIITGDSVSDMPSLPCIALPTSVPTSCVCFGKPPASEIPLAGAISISPTFVADCESE